MIPARGSVGIRGRVRVRVVGVSVRVIGVSVRVIGVRVSVRVKFIRAVRVNTSRVNNASMELSGVIPPGLIGHGYCQSYHRQG